MTNDTHEDMNFPEFWHLLDVQEATDPSPDALIAKLKQRNAELRHALEECLDRLQSRFRGPQ